MQREWPEPEQSGGIAQLSNSKFPLSGIQLFLKTKLSISFWVCILISLYLRAFLTNTKEIPYENISLHKQSA